MQKIWFKVKRVLFKTGWWSICNEKSIYNNLNYDHMTPQFGPLYTGKQWVSIIFAWICVKYQTKMLRTFGGEDGESLKDHIGSQGEIKTGQKR